MKQRGREGGDDDNDKASPLPSSPSTSRQERRRTSSSQPVPLRFVHRYAPAMNVSAITLGIDSDYEYEEESDRIPRRISIRGNENENFPHMSPLGHSSRNLASAPAPNTDSNTNDKDKDSIVLSYRRLGSKVSTAPSSTAAVAGRSRSNDNDIIERGNQSHHILQTDCPPALQLKSNSPASEKQRRHSEPILMNSSSSSTDGKTALARRQWRSFDSYYDATEEDYSRSVASIKIEKANRSANAESSAHSHSSECSPETRMIADSKRCSVALALTQYPVRVSQFEDKPPPRSIVLSTPPDCDRRGRCKLHPQHKLYKKRLFGLGGYEFLQLCPLCSPAPAGGGGPLQSSSSPHPQPPPGIRTNRQESVKYDDYDVSATAAGLSSLSLAQKKKSAPSISSSSNNRRRSRSGSKKNRKSKSTNPTHTHTPIVRQEKQQRSQTRSCSPDVSRDSHVLMSSLTSVFGNIRDKIPHAHANSPLSRQQRWRSRSRRSKKKKQTSVSDEEGSLHGGSISIGIDSIETNQDKFANPTKLGSGSGYKTSNKVEFEFGVDGGSVDREKTFGDYNEDDEIRSSPPTPSSIPKLVEVEAGVREFSPSFLRRSTSATASGSTLTAAQTSHLNNPNSKSSAVQKSGGKVNRQLYTTPLGESGWYTGEVDSDGNPHGHGSMRYKTGHSYEGNWNHGFGDAHLEKLNRMKSGFGTNKAAWKQSRQAKVTSKAGGGARARARGASTNIRDNTQTQQSLTYTYAGRQQQQQQQQLQQQLQTSNQHQGYSQTQLASAANMPSLQQQRQERSMASPWYAVWLSDAGYPPRSSRRGRNRNRRHRDRGDRPSTRTRF